MKNDVADILKRYIELDSDERRQFVFDLTEFTLAQPIRPEASLTRPQAAENPFAHIDLPLLPPVVAGSGRVFSTRIAA